MQKYIRCHIVEAKPCTLGEWEQETGRTWNEPDRPRTEEGYKCDYPSGYSGWCPKGEFDKVSHPIDGMTFGQAIDTCRYTGAKIQRKNWNGQGQYVEFRHVATLLEDESDAIIDEGNERDCFAFVFHFVNRKTGETGIQVGWLASQADMAADDWQTIE